MFLKTLGTAVLSRPTAPLLLRALNLSPVILLFFFAIYIHLFCTFLTICTLFQSISLNLVLDHLIAGCKIEKNEMGGTCGAYGEERDVHRVLVGKPEVKSPLGRPRRR
jgi:hypothetical protein